MGLIFEGSLAAAYFRDVCQQDPTGRFLEDGVAPALLRRGLDQGIQTWPAPSAAQPKRVTFTFYHFFARIECNFWRLVLSEIPEEGQQRPNKRSGYIG